MAQVKWETLAVLLALQVVSQLLLNLQWHRLACLADTPISFIKMLYINAQGSVIESITPGVKVGGEVTRALQISKLGHCCGEQAAAVVALQKLFSLSTFFLANLLAIAYLAGRVPALHNPLIQFLLYGVLGGFLILFALLFAAPAQMAAYFSRKRGARFLWQNRLRKFMLTLLEHLISFRSNRGEWIIQFSLSFLIWVLFPVKMYILVLQFLQGAHPIYVTAVTFVSYMVAMLPLFPGGLGGFEGTMSGLLLAMGLSLGDAAAIAVVFRFITFWFVIIASLVFTSVYKAMQKPGLASMEGEF